MVEGLEEDTAFVQALCAWAGKKPSAIANAIGSPASTLSRPFYGKAESRLSQPIKDRLRIKFPDFPGWRNARPDQDGYNPERPDPNEKTDDLVYIRQVDISLAMGEPAVVEEYPATQLVPFNMGFVRGVTNATTDKLLIFTGHGESMEPTLLRSDLLMIDTSVRVPAMSEQIWALHHAGGGMVKRIRHIREDGRNKYQLLSDNKDVPPQTAEIEDVHIIGKLIWVGRRM